MKTSLLEYKELMIISITRETLDSKLNFSGSCPDFSVVADSPYIIERVNKIHDLNRVLSDDQREFLVVNLLKESFD